MATKFYNLDTDVNLSANSDYLIASQKAIKANLDKKVNVTLKINGHTLDSDIELSASDIGALPSSTFIPSKSSDLEKDDVYTKDEIDSMVSLVLPSQEDNNGKILSTNGSEAQWIDQNKTTIRLWDNFEFGNSSIFNKE